MCNIFHIPRTRHAIQTRYRMVSFRSSNQSFRGACHIVHIQILTFQHIFLNYCDVCLAFFPLELHPWNLVSLLSVFCFFKMSCLLDHSLGLCTVCEIIGSWPCCLSCTWCFLGKHWGPCASSAGRAVPPQRRLESSTHWPGLCERCRWVVSDASHWKTLAQLLTLHLKKGFLRTGDLNSI